MASFQRGAGLSDADVCRLLGRTNSRAVRTCTAQDLAALLGAWAAEMQPGRPLPPEQPADMLGRAVRESTW